MLKALIQKFLSRGRKQTNVSGFTLLELLVSIIIASIVVGTLLVFLVNILERDRNEQAKVESQEEIQAALNFIADDMTDAVYIYDADGLYRNGAAGPNGGLNVASQLPHLQPTAGRCKDGTTINCTPVLVFWKRFLYKPSDNYGPAESNPLFDPSLTIDCLEKSNTSTCIGGDKYVYSLVVYYLLKNTDPDWSSSSRIIRWEIQDGLVSTCPTNTFCPPLVPADDPLVDKNNYASTFLKPKPGFRKFNLSGSGSLADRMNTWRKSSVDYDFGLDSTPYRELVDYIDDTPFDPTQDDGTIDNSPQGRRININIRANNPAFNPTPTPPVPSNPDCDDPNIGVGVGLTASQLGTTAQTVFSQRIPPDFSNATSNPNGLSSFYACVNANNVSARVFIRGNALARLKDNISSRPVSDAVFQSFLPTANVRVFGRGSLSVDE